MIVPTVIQCSKIVQFAQKWPPGLSIFPWVRVTELVPNLLCATFLVSLDEPGGVSMVVLSSNMGGGVVCHGVWDERQERNTAGSRWCVVCRDPTLEQGRLGRLLHPMVLWTLALGKTTKQQSLLFTECLTTLSPSGPRPQ